MDNALKQRLENILTTYRTIEVQTREIDYLKSAQTPAVKAEIDTWVSQYFSCYVTDQTPSKALDDVRAGRCTPFTLDQAKKELNKIYVTMATNLKDVDDVKLHETEIQTALAQITLALPAEADKKALHEYAKTRLEAALANREQLSSDENAAWILFWLSVLGLGRLPVWPTFEGNFTPTTSAHTITPDRMTPAQYTKRRLVLGSAQLLEALPPYDKWMNGLIEQGNGGTETGDMGANLSLGASVFGELPAAVNQMETAEALVPMRGHDMSHPLQIGTTVADMATIFTAGYRQTYQAARISVNRELCSHPDASNANQWRDSPVIRDWQAAHPGQPVPPEVIRQARNASSQQTACDEIVTAADAPADMLESYYYPKLLGVTTHGLVSDVIANQGWTAGLATGAAITVGFPLLQYKLRMNDPNQRWSLHQTAEESSRTPPGVGDDVIADGVKNAVIMQGVHSAIGTGLAALSFQLQTPGKPYDPYVAAGLLSAYGESVRAIPRETIINASALNNAGGSTLSLVPLGIENTMSALNALGDGYADAALWDRLNATSTKYDYAQRFMVFGGRALALGLTGYGIHEADTEHTGALLGLAAGRVAAYGVGYLLYLNPLAGNRDRVDLEGVHVGGPGGALASATLGGIIMGLKPSFITDTAGNPVQLALLDFSLAKR